MRGKRKDVVITPDSRTRAYYDAKYKIFHHMYEHQMEYKEMMNDGQPYA